MSQQPEPLIVQRSARSGRRRSSPASVPGMATLLRRSRRRPLGEVPTLRVPPEDGRPCADCRADEEEPSAYRMPSEGPPPVPWARVRAMPEGVELIEGGRVWARLPGGPPVKIFDGWERGGPFRYGLDEAPGTTEDEELEPVRLGVNTPYYFADKEGDDRYGTHDVITDDLSALGVGLVRHPGKAQLFLSDLLGGLGRKDDETVDTESVSIPASLAQLREDELKDVIGGSAPIANLRVLLREMRRRNLKVIVTLLTLGSGSSASGATFSQTEDSPEVLWSSDNKDQAMDDPWFRDDGPQPFNRATRDGATSAELWDLSTLDPENPYKRLFYRRVCSVVAGFLDTWYREEGWTWLPDVLAGLEIGNELDDRHKARRKGVQYVKPEAWGTFYADCAVAVREANDWVPLWLPGVTSYTEEGTEGDGRAGSFWGKVYWVERLVAEISTRLAAIDRGWTLDDVVAGMDVHWYHTDMDAARRAVLLPLELAELREALEVGLGQGFSGQVQMTVLECGINTMCGGAAVLAAGDTCDPAQVNPPAHKRPPAFRMVDFGVGVSYMPTLRPVHTLTWQAANLVIQIVSALAGGVRTVGPHGHVEIAPGGSNFAGMGLREDRHGRGTPADAWLRPSGAVYRRLAGLLRGVGEVSVVHPEETYYRTGDGAERSRVRLDVGEDLAAGTYPSSNHVVVIELEGLSSRRLPSSGRGAERVDGWGYLLYIDPIAGSNEAADNTPSGADVRLIMSSSSGDVWKLGIEPELEHPDPDSIPDDEFPTATVRFPPNESLAVTGGTLLKTTTVRLQRGTFPVLLLSTVQLRVGSITEYSGR